MNINLNEMKKSVNYLLKFKKLIRCAIPHTLFCQLGFGDNDIKGLAFTRKSGSQ